MSKKVSDAARTLGRKGAAKSSARLRAYWASLTPEQRSANARRGYERGIAAKKARDGQQMDGNDGAARAAERTER